MSLYRRTFLILFVYLVFRVLLSDYLMTQPKVLVGVPVRSINIADQSKQNDFLCHYFDDNGVLPVLNDAISFPLNSIFFINSACKDLTSRQACSVESAARANTDRQINVLFTSPMRSNSSIVKRLLSFANIRAVRIHLEDYANGTPLDGKFRKNPLFPEDLNIELADILKFLTLYKYTGTYLAMDVIVARSFDKLLKNWIVKESLDIISTDMFTFSHNDNGRAMAHVALNVIVNNLAMIEGDFGYRFDSDFVIKQFISLWCGVSDILFLNTSSCQELEVGSPINFFPIPFRTRQRYFIPGQLDQFKDRLIYTFVTWESYTKNYPVNENSLYVILAKKFCPTTYNFYGNKFGDV